MSSASPTPAFCDMLAADSPDRSGPRSSNRFAFQSSFGMCLLLGLHDGPDDYCVLFDVHDDIVSLNHPVNPTGAKFYQVKTKATGTWTADALVKSEKSKKTGDPLPSFLGKLYNHKLKFSINVQRITFVSNARFDVTMGDASNSKEHESICVGTLHADEQKTIADALASEHKLTTPPTDFDAAYLDTTPLSLTDPYCVELARTV